MNCRLYHLRRTENCSEDRKDAQMHECSALTLRFKNASYLNISNLKHNDVTTADVTITFIYFIPPRPAHKHTHQIYCHPPTHSLATCSVFHAVVHTQYSATQHRLL
jgi:hypothetical protein